METRTRQEKADGEARKKLNEWQDRGKRGGEKEAGRESKKKQMARQERSKREERKKQMA